MPEERLYAVGLLALVGFAQEVLDFVLGALGIVARPLRLLVLVDGAVALTGDVENVTELDMRPHLGPLGLEIPIERLAIFIGCRLVVVLEEVHFGDAEMRQRIVALRLERFLVLPQRLAELAGFRYHKGLFEEDGEK